LNIHFNNKVETRLQWKKIRESIGRESIVGNQYRNNSVCQVARKYTQRLWSRLGSIRPFARWAFPAALRINNISRRFTNLTAPLRTVSSYRIDPIPSNCARNRGFFKDGRKGASFIFNCLFSVRWSRSMIVKIASGSYETFLNGENGVSHLSVHSNGRVSFSKNLIPLVECDFWMDKSQ